MKKRKSLNSSRSYRDLGVCYLTLGGSYASLSGGEAQRLKLAYEMETPQQGSVFVFDEPTIGLHPSGCSKNWY